MLVSEFENRKFVLGNGGHRIMKIGELCVKVGKFVLENDEIIFGIDGMVFGNRVIVFENEGIWLGMGIIVLESEEMKKADFVSAFCRLASGMSNFKE